jgi:NAD(P)-dependent dehydrogenase (short-subunit alcohol dehydrogenase family)
MAVVVTGCDTGFGTEIAFWAAQAGFHVFAGCLLKESFGQFENCPAIKPIQMNVCNDNDVQEVVKQVVTWLDGGGEKKKQRVLHALINNAGIGDGGLIDWLDISVFQRNMDVNCFGMIRTCKAFLSIFKQQAIDGSHRGGRIMNLTSMAGLCPPMAAMAAYAASKHAANVFTRGLRNEMAGFGVQVCSLNPSFHKTPLVTGMQNNITSVYNGLSPTLRNQYGSDYFDTLKISLVDIPHSWSWNTNVVAEQAVSLLEINQLPAEVPIGLDGRFALLILRMIPGWCIDLVNYMFLPTPQSMRDPTKKKLQSHHGEKMD